MKRITSVLAVGLLSTSGAAPVVMADAHEDSVTTVSIYGSVRAGIYHRDPPTGEDTWDIGTVDTGRKDAGDDVGGGDKLWSRLGFRASHKLGNGMTSGLHIEKRLDNFRTRHQNVYLEGAFGRITLGQQGNPYYSAVTWDGTYLFGGASDPASRVSGVNYTTPAESPVKVDIGVKDDDSNDDGSSNDGVDLFTIAASYSTEFANLSAAYGKNDNSDTDSWGASASGSVGAFSWDVGYEARDAADDVDRYGFYTGYDIGAAGALYLYYEDMNTDTGAGEDDWTLFGYTYPIGPSTRFIAEHRTSDSDDSRTALALRVDF